MSNQRLRVAIIGSGFAGLGMAIRLKQSGQHSFTVFEAADKLGGTWRDNTYPGCACDVPSHLYSYSFELNSDWSRNFAPWHEIEAYLKHCATKYEIDAHIKYGTRITAARFDETTNSWRLTSATGERFTAQALVLGTGPLNKPVIPDIPGLATFAGKQFHSGAWDHTVGLQDRRVAVIGTGASAIQIVPAIAASVRQLYLLQRTPPWVMPRFERAISRVEKRLYRALPPLRRLIRTLIYWRLEALAGALLRDGRLRRLAEGLARRHLQRSIKDPQLRRALAPNYRIGCKRILLSDDYYASFARPNVELVTTAVTEVRPQGIVTADGRERGVDTLIFATGFAATDFITPLKVYGRGGQELSALWRSQAEAYLGITIAGFPNLFMLVGPNTGLGHNSIIFMIEAQVHYILEALQTLYASGRLEVKPEVQRNYNRKLQQRMHRTAWMSGCNSWYLSADGKNYTLYPGYTVGYWSATRKLNPSDYSLARS